MWRDFSALAELANLATMQTLENVPLLLSPELKCADHVNSMFNHFFAAIKPSANRNKQRVAADMIKLLLPLVVVQEDKEPSGFILTKAERLINQKEDVSCAVFAGMFLCQ